MNPLATFLRWRPGRLARNAFHGSLMYGARLALQALYFLLLARLLGVHQFGAFSGIWVLCGFLGALSGVGYPVLVFLTMAHEPVRAGECAARGFRTVASSAIPLIAVLLLVVALLLRGTLPVPVVAMLGVSEVLMVPMLSILASLRQGEEQLGRSHAIFASLWACRIAFLLIVHATVGEPAVQGAVGAHALATFCATSFWLLVEGKTARAADGADMRAPAGERLNGLYFAISGASLIAYTELNQSIVLALAGAAAAGLLAVAYKCVALLSAPLSAVCQAAAPRLVRAAREGRKATRTLVLALIRPMGAYALASSLGVFVVAELVPLVFGEDYAGARQLMAYLFLLPALSTLRLLASYVLVAMANQRNRTVAELVCLALGLLLNFLLISRDGLHGAVIAILATETLTACVLGVMAWRASAAKGDAPGETTA